MSVQEKVWTHDGVLWRWSQNCRWRPDPGECGAFKCQARAFGFGPMDSESSDLFRSRELGNLWALRELQEWQITLHSRTVCQETGLLLYICGIKPQPQARMPLNKIRPQIGQNGSFPNSPMNSYVPFASFLCLLETCVLADNEHRRIVFQKAQRKNLKRENILRIDFFSSDWKEAVL